MNVEFSSGDTLDTLLHELYASAEIGSVARAFEDQVDMVGHDAVRKNDELLELARFQNLTDRRTRQFPRVEGACPRFRDEAQRIVVLADVQKVLEPCWAWAMHAHGRAKGTPREP